MRVFNALFATLTTLLVAATLVVSAGGFLGQRTGTAPEVARTEAPGSRLVLERPRPPGSALATITPCLEPPSPLARLQ